MTPRTLQRLVGTVGVALVLSAISAWGASGRERSLAVYPAQRVPLSFNHRLHLEAGAECVTCHDAARKSTQSADLSLPKHPECETCHDIEKARRGQ